jgi:hypothetical protein
MLAEKRENIRATIPVPDHSDLRGFTYRAPTNIQGYNDSPKAWRARSSLKGQLYHRKGFWTSIANFFRGKKEPNERPLSPELVNSLRNKESSAPEPYPEDNFGARRTRTLPQEADSNNIWPG